MNTTMKMKKTTILPLVAAILFIAGTTSVFAMSTQADSDLSIEKKDRMLNKQNTVDSCGSTIGSYVNSQDGKTYYSFDNGQTFEPLTDQEFEQQFPAKNIKWWTYDEYKKWLKNEKVQLSDMIGETGWTKSQGEFVWTQEKVDKTIKMYEHILDEIKNGVLYSKSDKDGGYSMAINYNDIKMGTSSKELSVSIKLLDGEEVSFGPYTTKEELLAEVEPFCKEQVANKRMTQTEADEIITQYSNNSNFQ